MFQDRKKEIEFWDNESKKQRDWIQNTPNKDIINEIISREYWWEKLIGKIKGKKILDIGCGNTYFATYWQLTGNEAYGSDFSPETVKNNNLLHKKLRLKQNFYVTSAEKIRAKDNYLDIVHIKWVIHHIPPELVDKSMQEIKRVLKPKGKLIIFETNYAYPFRWIVQTPILRKFNFLRKLAIKKGVLDPEEKALTNNGYIDLLKRNGFKIKKIDYNFTFFYLPVHLLIKNRFIRNFTRKADFIITKILPNKFSNDIKIISEK
jgi:ubiquinone/menaquinone biosynthesis C-methylase UbiE